MFIFIKLLFPILFCWGFYGLVINRNNLIQLLISLELVVLSLIYNISILTSINEKISGVILFFIVTIIAAAESAIGLIIIVSLFKLRGDLSLINLSSGSI